MTALRREGSISNYTPTHTPQSIPMGGAGNVRNCFVCNAFKASLGGKSVKRFGSLWWTCKDCLDKKLVSVAGLEPTASCSQSPRSTR